MPVVKFVGKLPGYKLKHALEQGGQANMVFEVATLFQGNVDNLEKELRDMLVSTTCYKNTFDKAQRKKLKEKHFSNFDIPLLFKILQIGCGLLPRDHDNWKAPEDDECWTYDINGTESIEFLNGLLKNMRHSDTHDYGIILNLGERFGRVQQLLTSMMTPLVERAGELGKEVSIEGRQATMADVQEIIADAMEHQ